MYCMKCGRELPEGSRVCPDCDAAKASDSRPASPKKSAFGGKEFLSLALQVLGTVIALFFPIVQTVLYTTNSRGAPRTVVGTTFAALLPVSGRRGELVEGPFRLAAVLFLFAVIVLVGMALVGKMKKWVSAASILGCFVVFANVMRWIGNSKYLDSNNASYICKLTGLFWLAFAAFAVAALIAVSADVKRKRSQP